MGCRIISTAKRGFMSIESRKGIFPLILFSVLTCILYTESWAGSSDSESSEDEHFGQSKRATTHKKKNNEKEEDSPPKCICLMEIPSECGELRWLQQYTDYIAHKGRQQQRLESQDDYTRSYVRYVENRQNLTVGYGLLTQDKSFKIPKLQLDQVTYHKLSTLGLAVKVINGYVQNLDTGNDKTFTPDKANIFVPHISYIIQWAQDESPEFVPGGMLYDSHGCSIVMMSGAGTATVNEQIEHFYNHIYRDDTDDKITVYSGNKVAEDYVPYDLHRIVERKLDGFRDSDLAKLCSKIQNKLPFTKGAKDSKLQAQNTLNLTFQFLNLLLENKFEEIFTRRSDTVRRLLKEFIKDSSIQIDEEENKEGKKLFKKGSFISVLKSKKIEFIDVALKRISQNIPSINSENQSLVTNIVWYVLYSVKPEPLKKIEESKKFWKIINDLGRFITCVNPDSQYGAEITIAERLKKHALSGFNGSHTEPLFIKLIRTQSNLLVQHLQQAVDSHKDSFNKGFHPRFLGFIVDGFSWLDICGNCGNYLHTNELWNESLQEVKYSIESIGFLLPFLSISSLFRMVSQVPYSGPVDLSEASGGEDYTTSGWDFRLLSEMRYALSTRTLPKASQLQRDKVFEKIPTSITRVALSKPIEFWQQNPSLSRVILASPTRETSSVNAIDILLLRFPNSIPLVIKKIVIAQQDKNYDEILELAGPIIKEEIQLDETNKKFVDVLVDTPCFSRYPKYLVVYFAEACLKKAKEKFKMKEAASGWGYLTALAKFGLLESKEALESEEPFSVVNCLIKYWEERWKAGNKLDNWNNPEAQDKVNTKESIKLLWKLAYKVKKYSSSLIGIQVTMILRILDESKLEKPSFLESH